jgi:hypothetical protein
MVRDPNGGRERFAELIHQYGEDGMILFNRATAYQKLGEARWPTQTTARGVRVGLSSPQTGGLEQVVSL